MTADHRTYRVPKRVVKQVDAALSGAGRQHGNDRTALDMASALTGGRPVDIAVPLSVTEFFTRDWRFHASKVRDAGLYGGPIGLEWARKCVGSTPVVADAAPAEIGYGEAVSYSHEDVERLIAFGRVASSPRWSPVVEDEDEVAADLAAAIDAAFVPAAGVEDLAADLVAPPPEPGVAVLSMDDEDEREAVDGLTVAAMRDAVAAASAALATLRQEGSHLAEQGADHPSPGLAEQVLQTEAPVADAVAEEVGGGDPKA